ncbi:conserved hypothetical protein [Rhizobium sp. EC-SD404]|nr:conserved hypothetical protein [Rhizobium sp. EC-SD404]
MDRRASGQRWLPCLCLESWYVQAALGATTVKTGWNDAQGTAQIVQAQLTNDKAAECTLAA